MTDAVDTSKEAVERVICDQILRIIDPRRTGDHLTLDDYVAIIDTARALLAERDQLRREVEEAREHKHRIQDCVVDLSEAGYLCFVKHPDGLIGAYDEGDRVFLDVGTGNIDACGLHILSNSALEKKLSEARAKALRIGYLVGFNASGEGWNGEFPYADGKENPEDDEDWVNLREDRLEYLKARP